MGSNAKTRMGKGVAVGRGTRDFPEPGSAAQASALAGERGQSSGQRRIAILFGPAVLLQSHELRANIYDEKPEQDSEALGAAPGNVRGTAARLDSPGGRRGNRRWSGEG